MDNKKAKRRCGDRADGRLIRTLDPLTMLIPFIMQTRTDAQNLFEDRIEISHAQHWLRTVREADPTLDIGLLHIVIAACVRTLALRPRVNRFVKNGRIYARNEIAISIAIKKTLEDDGVETTIKIKFDARDTIYDIRDRLNAALEQNKKLEVSNSADRAAAFFVRLPPLILKSVIGLLNFLDNHGALPNALRELSPFHTSMWLTDLGSIGIQSIYHHIYEFGTTSAFFAFGTRTKEREITEDGTVHTRTYLTIRAVTDERIVDGFYYAATFRLFRRLMSHPELLAVMPDEIPADIK